MKVWKRVLVIAVSFMIISMYSFSGTAGLLQSHAADTASDSTNVTTQANDTSQGAGTEADKSGDTSNTDNNAADTQSNAKTDNTGSDTSGQDAVSNSDGDSSGNTATNESNKSDEDTSPAVTLNDSVGSAKITAYAPKGALPKGVTMKASEVSDDSVKDAVSDKLSDGQEIKDVAAYDISFYKDGAKIEPASDVSVSITGTDVSGDEYGLYHMDSVDSSATKVSDATATADNTNFSSDDFSIYIIVGSGKKASHETHESIAKSYSLVNHTSLKLYSDYYWNNTWSIVSGSENVALNSTSGNNVTVTANNEGSAEIECDSVVWDGWSFSTVKAYFYITVTEGYANINYRATTGGTVTNPTDNILEKNGIPAGSTANAGKGYHFVNWTDSSGKVVSDTELFLPSKSANDVYETATYTANFEKNDPIITFDPNGATGTAFTMNVSSGAFTYPNPSDYGFTRTGYTFIGWSTNPKGDSATYVSGIQQSNVTEDTTYYAIWLDNAAADNQDAYFFVRTDNVIQYEPASYGATAYYPTTGEESSRNHGTIKAAIAVNNNLANVKANISSQPSADTWKTIIHEEGGSFDPDTQEIVWYVIKHQGNGTWHVDGVVQNKTQHRVTYNPNGGNTNVPGAVQYVKDANVDVNFTTIPSRTGYHFVGWDENADASASNVTYTANGTTQFVMPDRDVTLYAIWTPDNQTVTVNYLDESDNSVIAKQETRNAVCGSEFNVNSHALKKNISGYTYHNASPGEKITVDADNSKNVINLLYTKKATLTYTINYYKDSVGAGNKLGDTVTVGDQTFGTDVTLTTTQLNAQKPTGYKDGVSTPTSIKIAEDGNNFNVVYTKKDNLSYTINYYKDSVDAGNKLGDTVTVGDQTFGTDVTLTTTQLNAQKPTGYKDGVSTPTSIKIAEDGNNFDVVYAKKDNLSYTINYYKDSVGAGNKLGDTVTVGDQTFGTDVTLTTTQLNAQKPTGYKDGVSAPTSIKIAEDGNNFNVVYAKKDNLSYTINYYKDSVTAANKLGGTTTVDNQTFGAIVTLTATQLNLKKPVTGYKDGVSTPTSIKIAEDGNNFDVVYAKKDNLSYTINYYKDSVGAGNKLGDTVTVGDQTFGTDVTLTTTQLNAQKPTGYKDGVSTPTSIKIAEDGNNFDVVYAKKDNLSYTINYYKDSVGAGNKLGDTVTVGDQTFGTDVTLTNTQLNAQKPTAGYNSGWSSPSQIVIQDGTNNFDVVYTKKVTLTYTINYYKDSVDAGNKLGDTLTVGDQTFGTDVTLTTTQLNAQKPTGYKDGVSTPTSIKIAEDGNNFNVVYTKKDNLSYTINYYKDSVDAGNKLGDTLTVGDQTFGTDVTLTTTQLNAQKPTGYKDGVSTPTSIKIAEDGNNFNVVYTKKDNLSYTINYYKDSVDAGNKLGDTVTVGDQTFGTDVTLTTTQLNAQKPTGYKDGVSTPTSIKIAESGNNFDVVYAKKDNLSYTINYYKDSVDAGNKLGDTLTVGDQTFGTDVTLTTTQLNAQKPTGYKDGVSTPTSIKIAESGNNFNVVYTKKDNLSYTINYYKDSVDAGNKLGDTVTVGDQTFGTDVTLTTTQLNAQKPTGYKDGVSTPTSIKIAESGNNFDVVYAKKDNLSYTINYYKDSVDAGNKLGDTLTVGDQTFGTDVTLTNTQLNAQKPTGYKDGVSAPTSIKIAEDGNNFNVVYSKDEEQTKTLSYTVNYYKNNVKVNSDSQTITKTVWVNDPNTIDVTSSNVNIVDKYVGYSFDYYTVNEVMREVLSVSDPQHHNSLPITVTDGAVIDVYYVQNPTPTPTPTTGSITVTKNTFLDGTAKTIDQTFYAAAFDENGKIASDIKPISMNGDTTASITFTGLALDKTYTIYETDAGGNIITDPSTQKVDGWAKITYANNTVKLTADNTSAASEINNYFETVHPAYGSVKVTKVVKVDGKAKATNNTYYAALFSDSSLTNRVTDVKALSMNGKTATSVTFLKDKDGNYLKTGTTYYVAETTSSGKAITNGKNELGCTISISNTSVKISTSNMSPSSTITNEYSDSVHPYDPNHNGGGNTADNGNGTGVKTGDNFDMGIWTMMAALGLAGASGVLVIARRKNKADK